MSEEAQTKDDEADNAEGRICPWVLSGFKENLSGDLVAQESVMDPMINRTSKLRCAVVLPECKWARASVTSVTPSPYCTHGCKLVLGANARSDS